MFDVWMGDIELTTLTLILSFAVVLPMQLLLCFKIRSRILRLLPALLLAVPTVCFGGMSIASSGWDGLGYMVLDLFAGFMLCMCGVGWAIWGITKLVKRITALRK